MELGTNIGILLTAKYVDSNYTFGNQENDMVNPLHLFLIQYPLHPYFIRESPWPHISMLTQILYPKVLKISRC